MSVGARFHKEIGSRQDREPDVVRADCEVAMVLSGVGGRADGCVV